jgi:hypothetical protein
VKAVVRVIVKVVVAVVAAVVNVVDLLAGFLLWPEKNLRLRVVVLADEKGLPLVSEADLEPMIEGARRTLKVRWTARHGGAVACVCVFSPASVPRGARVAASSRSSARASVRQRLTQRCACLLTPRVPLHFVSLQTRFNVKLLPFDKTFTQFVSAPAPSAALDVQCGAGALGEEFSEAGDFFASHTAGWWFGVPTSGRFPVTAFVVRDVKDGKLGCSLGPLSDYVTVDREGVQKSTRTLAHEIGHSCSLWHVGDTANLMFHSDGGGDGVRWWQCNLFRSSRHVTYW